MTVSMPTLLTALAALAVVLGLIVLGARAARVSGLAPRLGAGRRIAVEEITALDARRRLHLVSCEGRRVLLLTGGAQDLVLGWLPESGS
jgi:flagellar protein FliO/FliZ